MIDTVAVKYHIEVTPQQLGQWRKNYDVPEDDKVEIEQVQLKRYQRSFMDNGVTVTFTSYPANGQYPQPYLRIDVSSLPKILFGNNIQMITEPWQVEEAIRRINSFLRETGLVPDLDFGEGVLSRLDICYNHQVGDRVSDYLRAISALDYPHRERVAYKHGVLFKSDVVSSEFYDKHHRNPVSPGFEILRQEIRIKDPGCIAENMGIEKPTLRDVTFEWLVRELEKDLHRLHLDDTMIYNRDEAQEVLVNTYGYRMGVKLLGHLVSLQSTTREQMLANGMKDSTRRRWEKLIRDAGVSLAMTDKVTLLPLHVSVVGALKNEQKVLSETRTSVHQEQR